MCCGGCCYSCDVSLSRCVHWSCLGRRSLFSQQASMQQNTMRPVRQTQRPTVRRPAPDSKKGTWPDILHHQLAYYMLTGRLLVTPCSNEQMLIICFKFNLVLGRLHITRQPYLKLYRNKLLIINLFRFEGKFYFLFVHS